MHISYLVVAAHDHDCRLYLIHDLLYDIKNCLCRSTGCLYKQVKLVLESLAVNRGDHPAKRRESSSRSGT